MGVTKATALFIISGAGRGGVARAFDTLAQCLEDAGWAVKVLLPYENDVRTAAIAPDRIVGFAKRRLVSNKALRILVKLFHGLTGYRFYWQNVPRVEHDLLCVYNAGNVEHWSRYSTRPSIVWFHNNRPDQPPSWCNPIRWLNHYFISRNLRRFTYRLSVSEETGTSCFRYYGLPKEPFVLPNLLDVDGIVQQSQCRQDEIKRSDRPQFIYVGRISGEKGCRRMLQIVQRLVAGGYEFDLWCVGDGPLLREMIEFVHGERLDAYVHFIGARDNPYPYIKAASILLLLSHSEGFGLVLWEALILHRPVIATDCGGTRTALKDGEWGMLIPNDEESIYHKLKDCLDTPSGMTSAYNFDKISTAIRQKNLYARDLNVKIFNDLKDARSPV